MSHLIKLHKKMKRNQTNKQTFWTVSILQQIIKI